MEAVLSKVTVADWTKQKRVVLNGDINSETRIGEIVNKAIHALKLPNNVTYGVFLSPSEGEAKYKLNKSDTVTEAELEEGAELMIAPEVSAG
jgi:hypothetical protein